MLVFLVFCSSPKKEVNENVTSAVSSNNLSDLKTQIDNGASSNSTDSKGFSASHYAASNGNLEIIKYLADEKADFKAEDAGKATPLHHAAFNGNLPVVKYLIEEEDVVVNVESDRGFRAIDRAAVKGHSSVVKYLLTQGSSAKAPAKNGETPLHMACFSGNLETVKIIATAKEVDIDAKEIRGYTPLHYAAYYGYPLIVDYLLSKKAEINATAKDGKTPLDLAKVSKKNDVVKLLKEKGAK